MRRRRKKPKRPAGYYSEIGRKGGKSNARAHGSKHFARIAAKRNHFLGGRPRKNPPCPKPQSAG